MLPEASWKDTLTRLPPCSIAVCYFLRGRGHETRLAEPGALRGTTAPCKGHGHPSLQISLGPFPPQKCLEGS